MKATVMASLSMKYIAAYLLAQAGGDPNPSKDKIKTILESVGIEVDDAVLTAVIAKLEGQDTAALIQKGAASLTGGGATSAAAAAAPAAAEAPAESAPVKEEKKEEEVVVGLAEGFDDLFGDD
jgi:large subunit ribosomal protein LP2